MNISLTPELEEIVQGKVKSGLYHSASEVIREALRYMYERDRLRELKFQELQAEVQIGLEQIDRGQTTPFDADDIIQRGQERLAARKTG